MRTTIQLVNHFTVSIMQLAAALLLFALAMPVQSQSLNPESVEFFYPDGQPLASVALDGCIALENITGQPDWLTATFDNEVCDQFDSVMIELALVSSVVGDLEPGVYEADLTITGTNSFEQPFSLGLPVTLTVDNNGDFPTPILTTNPSSLTFTTIQGSGIASPTSASVTVTLDFVEENCDPAAEPEISWVDDQILEYVLVSPTFGAGCSVVFEITPTSAIMSLTENITETLAFIASSDQCEFPSFCDEVDFDVIIEVVPPTLTATITSPSGNQTINAGESIDFAGEGNSNDPQAMLSYLWDFDGAAPDSTQQDPGPISFEEAGTYTVTFTVGDDLNDLSDTDSVVITVESPQPSGTITDVDFGIVTIGQTSTGTATVTSTGEANLIIESVFLSSGSGPVFNIENDACTESSLPPGQNCQIQISCTPDQTMSYSGALFVFTNADEVPLEANLSCIGEETIVVPTGSSRLFLYINGFHEYPVSIIRRVRNGGSHAQALHRSPERGGTRFIDGAGLQRAGGGLPDQARQRAAGGGRRWAGVER